MRRLWGLLLAAGALIPGAASAQEGAVVPGEHARGMQASLHGEGQRARPPSGDNGGWRRPDGQIRPWQGGQGRPPGGEQPGWQRQGGAPGAGGPGWQRPGGTPGAGAPGWQQRPEAGNQQRPGWGQRPPSWGGNGGGQWRPPGMGQPNPRPDQPPVGEPRPGQPRPDWHGNGGGRWDGQWGNPSRPGGPRGERPRWGGDWNRPSTGWQRERADWIDSYRNDRDFQDRAAWNRGWRSDERYDWSRRRAMDRGRFHLPRYYAPHSWTRGYRRFSVGVVLSQPLFAEDYWIDEPQGYELPPVYGPYRWVRYYNDALLVDLRYGQVVDVVYDIFW